MSINHVLGGWLLAGAVLGCSTDDLAEVEPTGVGLASTAQALSTAPGPMVFSRDAGPGHPAVITLVWEQRGDGAVVWGPRADAAIVWASDNAN